MTQRRLLPQLLILFAFTAVAVIWALFILEKGGGLPVIGEQPYEVSATIPSGAALAPGSRVTMAGVEVGSLESVERRGVGAYLVLRIDDENVLPLAEDTRVQVRQHTPVGENYIALTAGESEETLASGGELEPEQADEFVDVDRLLSVLKGDTRERARMTVQSMGGALEGRGEQLNQLVGDTSSFLDSAKTLVDVLYGDREQASRLIEQLGDVTASIGQRNEAIRTIADQGLASLDAIRSSDDALRRTIEELPGTLQRVRTTSDTVRSVSDVTKPVVDDATTALRQLEPAVDRLRPSTAAGRDVLRDLAAAAPGLEQTLDEVTALSGPLSGALPKIHKTICEGAPTVRYIKPYTTEMLHILSGLGSSSNAYDATGHLVRLQPIFGENAAVGLPPEASEAAFNLFHSAPGTFLNWNPYPEPGSLGKAVADSNSPLGFREMRESGFVYPRVKADC